MVLGPMEKEGWLQLGMQCQLTAPQSPAPRLSPLTSLRAMSSASMGSTGLRNRRGHGQWGQETVAQGGYSQIPGPGVKVSKQRPPPQSRPPQLNGASVWRQRALQRLARAGSPRTGSLGRVGEAMEAQEPGSLRELWP